MFFPQSLPTDLLNLQRNSQMLPASRSFQDFSQFSLKNSHKLPEHFVILHLQHLTFHLIPQESVHAYFCLSFCKYYLCQASFRDTKETEINSTLSLGPQGLNFMNESGFRGHTAPKDNYGSTSKVQKRSKLTLLMQWPGKASLRRQHLNWYEKMSRNLSGKEEKELKSFYWEEQSKQSHSTEQAYREQWVSKHCAADRRQGEVAPDYMSLVAKPIVEI